MMPDPQFNRLIKLSNFKRKSIMVRKQIRLLLKFSRRTTTMKMMMKMMMMTMMKMTMKMTMNDDDADTSHYRALINSRCKFEYSPAKCPRNDR